ncbi:winged helix-turn-helix domain-containing protein [Sphingosinicella terrae]|uniref:winged helix-turn-helix domain-containing protein n=1 Tax=Sphingosinicella terrae TaxID=2172047 RepID=UPI000E0D80FD|nr:crosslink repair DNA glycosylase YcaQ family protein [Sphingosinicella terrae]
MTGGRDQEIESVTLAKARRIALAAQGFAGGASRPLAIVGRLGVLQIDSVNVLARAHYLPVFSRTGGYDRDALDAAAWGCGRRRLFEYWAHEASLLPVELQPLLRWRMARAERGEGTWAGMRAFAGERRHEAEAVLERIRAEGPLAASDFDEGKGRGGWWEWGHTKRVLEWLFWAGLVTTATRRGGFERVYDLPERVLPPAILDLPTPDEKDAQRTLLARAAAAVGIATAGDLRDYFRLKPNDALPRIDELVEAGTIRPVRVDGWKQPAFVHAQAKRPRRRLRTQALLAPFDPLVWHRPRLERLFGVHYRIEIYTPADKRVFGYYVLPFLMDEAIVARVDLKADRQAGLLRVRAAHAEPNAPDETAPRLMEELRRMAEWLGLGGVAVEPSGDLAPALSRCAG